VLPLGPTGFGDSPYASFSAFAGNPYLIDFEPFLTHGLLRPEDLKSLDSLPGNRVDYGALYVRKWPLLRHLWRNFQQSGRAYLGNYGLFEDFKQREAEWLDPFATFMAAKERFGGRFWGEWPEAWRTRPSAMKQPGWEEVEEEAEAHRFFQYLFYGQWEEVRRYAREAGVQIIGDIPIFVALDSADVWAHPELFKLGPDKLPAEVAGVPPDYFSADGQLWGNPLYDWKCLKADGYRWWIRRFEQNFRLFDVARLDHFRGFVDYWSVPAGAETAKAGNWQKGPRSDLFKAVFEALPEVRIIAEDLGLIGDDVRRFRDRLGLPGMAILQFAFDLGSDNLYLPHNLTPNSVVYPGTHDNNTTRGWYEEAPAEIQDQVRRYLRISGQDISWDIIRAAYRSVSRLAIIPMQDLLALDAEARMNRPGSEQGNWQWRMTDSQFAWQRGSAAYLRELAWLYGR